MDLYRRMAAVRNREDREELLDEIVDRYGEPEKSVINLVDIALLRADAAALGITEIRQFGGALHFRLETMDVLDWIESADQEPYFRKRISVYAKEDKVFIKLLLPKESKPLKEAQALITVLGTKEKN